MLYASLSFAEDTKYWQAHNAVLLLKVIYCIQNPDDSHTSHSNILGSCWGHFNWYWLCASWKIGSHTHTHTHTRIHWYSYFARWWDSLSAVCAHISSCYNVRLYCTEHIIWDAGIKNSIWEPIKRYVPIRYISVMIWERQTIVEVHWGLRPNTSDWEKKEQTK